MPPKAISLCPHGVMKGAYCDECEAEKFERAHQVPPMGGPQPETALQPKWVRIHLKSGGRVDLQQPPGFNFSMWVLIVKGGGGVITDTMHVPWENIDMLIVLDSPNQELKGIHFAGKPN